MQDSRSAPSRSRARAVEPEPTEEELSRAAREAVRQPADPRLDAQLMRLGLLPDDAEEEPPPKPSTAGDGSTATARDVATQARPTSHGASTTVADLDQLRRDWTAWQETTTDAIRQLQSLTWAALVLSGLVLIIVLVVLTRG